MFTRLGCSGRPPHFVVEFFPYAGLVQTIRLRGDVALVRFSDLMQSAPPRVLEAAAAILLGKLYRRRVPADLRDLYREYSLAHGMRRRVHHLRRRRARRATLPPAGACHNLDPLFDQLNRDYFSGALRRPQLGWSARPWRKQLGCFDPALDQIVLSSRLDRPAVPRYVVEYVLYHEMLHVKHPVRRASARSSAISNLKSQISSSASLRAAPQPDAAGSGCGLQIHSPAFRAEERRFAHFPAARRWLRRHA